MKSGTHNRAITKKLTKLLEDCRKRNILFSIISGGAVNEYTTVVAVGTLEPAVFIETDKGAIEKLDAFIYTAYQYMQEDSTGKGWVEKQADPNTFTHSLEDVEGTLKL